MNDIDPSKPEKDRQYFGGRVAGFLAYVGITAAVVMGLDNIVDGPITRSGEEFRKTHPTIMSFFDSNDTSLSEKVNANYSIISVPITLSSKGQTFVGKLEYAPKDVSKNFENVMGTLYLKNDTKDTTIGTLVVIDRKKNTAHFMFMKDLYKLPQ